MFDLLVGGLPDVVLSGLPNEFLFRGSFFFFPALYFFAFRFANDAAFYGARVNRPARIVSSECHLMFYLKILIREPQFGTRFFIWHQPKGTEPIQGTKPEKSAQSGRRFDQMCP